MAHVNYLGLTPVIPVVTTDSSLVGQGTYYPIGFTKEEWVYFYWKVKLFGFRGSASWTHPVIAGYTSVGDTGSHSLSTPGLVASLNYQENVTFNPTSERDLICRDWTDTKLYASHFGSFGTGDSFGFETLIFGAPVFHASDPTIPEVNCYFLDGLYYPFFFFNLAFGEILIESLNIQDQLSVSVLFLGKQMTMKARIPGYDPFSIAFYGGSGTPAVSSSTIEIYAGEEWSYQ
jgi:hypothetical protein